MTSWRAVVGYEGLYEVSNDGRVRGLDRVLSDGRKWKGTILSAYARKSDGYHKLVLYAGAVRKDFYVHDLVLRAFIGPPPAGMECCHGAAGKDDNSLQNLRWGFIQVNLAERMHAFGQQNGAYTKPYRRRAKRENGQAKFPVAHFERAADLLRAGCQQKAVGSWLGISTSHMCRIARGQVYV